MKRTGLLLLCLLFPCLAGEPAIDSLVDRLFADEPGVRAEARAELLALGDGTLERVLHRIEARQGGPVLQVYDVRDLQTDERWWGLTRARIRKAAHGAERLALNPEAGTLLLLASRDVHERVGKELDGLRRFLGALVHLEVRLVALRRPGGAVPDDLAEDEVAAFLEKRRGEVRTAPRLTCRNAQTASVELLNQVSYVADFDLEAEEDGWLADPRVDVVEDGITLTLRPVLGADESVRVAVEIRRTDVARPLPTLPLPLPGGQSVEIQVPETSTTIVTRLVTCRPGRVAVLDVGGGHHLLLGAAPLRVR